MKISFVFNRDFILFHRKWLTVNNLKTTYTSSPVFVETSLDYISSNQVNYSVVNLVCVSG